MKIRTKFMATTLSLAASAGGAARAADVYAYVFETIPASADVLVSVPVNNTVETELEVAGISGVTLSVANTPEFATGDFNAGSFPKFYVRFIDGPAAGLWSSVTVNSETSITLDDADVASLAGAGDTIRVYAHQTIGSVFPDALLDRSFVEGTQVLTFSDADSQNKAAGSGSVNTYTTFLGIGWGSNADRPLFPEEAFIIRNTSGTELQYIATGVAPDHPISYLIGGSVTKDTPLGTGFPVPVTVEQTGLGVAEGRQILLQDADVLNPAPGSDAVFTYTFFLGIGWGANASVDLAPNSAFIMRQSGTDAGGVATVESPY